MRIIRPKRNNDEAKLQALFAGWLDSKGILFNASVSAVKVPVMTAVKMKRAGYKKGYPDIFIYHKNQDYAGMAIELKSKTGKITIEQQQWRNALLRNGYYAVIMPAGLELLEGLNWLQHEVDEYLSKKVAL